MENAPKIKKSQELTHLLKRINQGGDPKFLRKEAIHLLPEIEPSDIAAAEQNLINAGFSAKLVQELSAVFVLMGILEEQNLNLRDQLPGGHIIRRVLAEHELARCFMEDLKTTTEVIQKKTNLTDTSVEFRKLAHIVEHLNAMEEHIEREEDIIFPFLKKHGWASICRSARSQHVYIRIATSDLIRLIGTYKKSNLKEFKARLDSITGYLYPTMAEHLFQEDYLLYPIALQVINDEELWEQLKNVCEEIGYCGVHV